MIFFQAQAWDGEVSRDSHGTFGGLVEIQGIWISWRGSTFPLPCGSKNPFNLPCDSKIPSTYLVVQKSLQLTS